MPCITFCPICGLPSYTFLISPLEPTSIGTTRAHLRFRTRGEDQRAREEEMSGIYMIGGRNELGRVEVDAKGGVIK